MTTSVAVRKARAADVEDVRFILEESGLGEDGVSEQLQGFFVAEVDGNVVGTIGLELYGAQGLLRSAAVLPSYRSRGIGDSLVAALTEFARERGIKELVLLTTTAADYFERRGFSRIARQNVTGDILASEQFRSACPSTAVVLRKSVG